MKSDNPQNGAAQDPSSEYVSESGAENMVADQRIYRKTLTMATIEALPQRCIVAKKIIPLCRWGGLVRGTVQEWKAEDANKPMSEREIFTGLVGEFEADVFSDDGEVFTFYGGQTYLPKGFHEAVLSQFQSVCDAALKEKSAISPTTRFNLEFAAEPTGKGVGYRYLARNMDPVLRRTDELELMRVRARLARQHADLPSLEGPRRGQPLLEQSR